MSNTIYRYELSFPVSVGNVGAAMMNAGALTTIDGIEIGGLCVDKSGPNIFFSDPKAHAIFRLNGLNGSISLYAGTSGTAGNDGDAIVAATNAKFNTPGGLSCDNSGNVYVADTGNNQIRVIGPKQKVGLFAGDPGGAAGFTTGVPTQSQLNGPQDVAVDNSGYVYIADRLNHAIRRVKGGVLTTLAGDGTSGDDVGTTANARFNRPYSVAVTQRRDILVADSSNYQIKLIRGSNVYLFFGAKAYGDSLAAGELHNLRYSDVDKRGNFFVLDYDNVSDNSRLLKFDENSNCSIVIDFEAAKDPIIKGFALDISNQLFVGCSDRGVESSSSSTEESTESSLSSSSSSYGSSASSVESSYSTSSFSTKLSQSSSSESSASSESSITSTVLR